MTTQQWMWAGAGGAALVLAALAGVAESRRTKRRRLDAAGWMPWRGVQVMSLFAAVLFLILAMRA